MRSGDVRAHAGSHAGAGRRPAARVAVVMAGGTAAQRERHRARGKLLPRDRVNRLLDPGSPFLELGAARRLRHVRRRSAGRRHHHRHRPRRRPRMRDRRQRRDGEGRHLLSDHREEAPARPGDRAREPPAVHLSRRFGRRQPAQPGRGVPRPRSFRPHLLQPGDHVGAGHSADRRGDGLVHRGRRLRAGDVRRERSSSGTRARSSSAGRRW